VTFQLCRARDISTLLQQQPSVLSLSIRVTLRGLNQRPLLEGERKTSAKRRETGKE
jgi:hypothetical protein